MYTKYCQHRFCFTLRVCPPDRLTQQTNAYSLFIVVCIYMPLKHTNIVQYQTFHYYSPDYRINAKHILLISKLFSGSMNFISVSFFAPKLNGYDLAHAGFLIWSIVSNSKHNWTFWWFKSNWAYWVSLKGCSTSFLPYAQG